IFFNDTLWVGFQTWAFIFGDPDASKSGGASHASELTAQERQRFASDERVFRDRQEEYWRAYQILNDIVAKSGRSELGRLAGNRAIACLRRINVNRFGRSKEIHAADRRLTSWLAGS